VWFEDNPSDGNLLVWIPFDPNPGYWNIWPLERYEFAALARETFWHKAKLQPFATEGAGFLVTRSLVKNSGWSEDPAPVYGGGLSYKLSKHWRAEWQVLTWLARTGCYGDPACVNRGSFAVSVDPSIALRLDW
jgi:hypothetical protein